VYSIITFVVIAFVVFWIAKLLIRESEAAPAGPSDEVKLLTEIGDELRNGEIRSRGTIRRTRASLSR
jgi:large-conductance mechanosensitive channel